MTRDTLCYLVIVTRNKWADYRLVTDLPSFFDSENVGLNRSLRSLFPLDQCGNEISVSRSLVSHSIYLQAWTGRLDCFDMMEVPYTSEQGRPIKLGVGVIQKLSPSGQYESYELSCLGELTCKVIREFQLFKEYHPIIIELSALGISGNPTFLEHRSAIRNLDLDFNKASKEPPNAEAVDVNHRLVENNVDLPVEPASDARTAVSDVYSEDAEFLIDQSIALFGGLLSTSACNSCPELGKWALMATKNLERMSEARRGDSVKDIYRCIRVIWRLEGPKVFGIEVKHPFWGAPISPISEHQIKLLRLQVTGFLEYISDTRVSSTLVLHKLEQLQDTLRQIVSDVLG